MLRGKYCANTAENIKILSEKGFSVEEGLEKSFADFIEIDSSGKIILIYPDDEYFLNKNNKISLEELENPKICSLNSLDKEILINMYFKKCDDLKNLDVVSESIHKEILNTLKTKLDLLQSMYVSKSNCF